MTLYRLYQLTPDDHIAAPPDEIECASDQEAITHAKQKLNGAAIEVWEGARVVTKLESQHRK